jgi:hypothetical protein
MEGRKNKKNIAHSHIRNVKLKPTLKWLMTEQIFAFSAGHNMQIPCAEVAVLYSARVKT